MTLRLTHNAPHVPFSSTLCAIKKVPYVLLRKFQDYLTYQDIFRAHTVCKQWHQLLPIDGTLNLSSLTQRQSGRSSALTGCILRNIITEYNKGSKLVSLNLAACTLLKNEDLKILKHLSITHLDLTLCKKINATGLSYLSPINLKSLILQCVPIRDKALSVLSKMSITALDLSQCSKLTHVGFRHLKQLALKKLELFGVEMTKESLKAISVCQINELYLYSLKPIEMKSLSYLKKMPLSHLDWATHDTISDEYLTCFVGLPLVSLKLYECREISDQGLYAIKSLPLKKLGIHKGHKISDKGISYLTDLRLTDLTLSDCPLVSNKTLKLISEMPLSKLNLDRCTMLSDEGMGFLAQLELTELHISCIKITDRGMAVFRNKLIKKLVIQGEQMTDEALKHVATLSMLEELLLDDCPNVTDKGIEHLRHLKLNYLSLNGCFKITDKCSDYIYGFPLTQGINLYRTPLSKGAVTKLSTKIPANSIFSKWRGLI